MLDPYSSGPSSFFSTRELYMEPEEGGADSYLIRFINRHPTRTPNADIRGIHKITRLTTQAPLL